MTAAADATQHGLFVEPAEIGGTKREALIVWYERHGFERIRETIWHRPPKPLSQWHALCTGRGRRCALRSQKLATTSRRRLPSTDPWKRYETGRRSPKRPGAHATGNGNTKVKQPSARSGTHRAFCR